MMTLAEALLLGNERIVALVGGGGKTTAMYRLAKELVAAGNRVIVTTTTNIFLPTPEEAPTTIVEESLPIAIRLLRQALREFSLIGLGSRLAADGHLKGIPPEWVAEVAQIEGVDYVLVEADGSARKPLKAPADHEPVIPVCADVVVPVVGIDVIGRPIGGDTVHRPERVCAVAQVEPGEPVSAEIVARVILHPLGLAKGTPPGARIAPLINKVDGDSALPAAREVAWRLLAGGLPRVVIARAMFDPPVVEIVERSVPSPGTSRSAKCSRTLQGARRRSGDAGAGNADDLAPLTGPRSEIGAATFGTADEANHISVVVLAAGRATRMGGSKLLLEVEGTSLIRRVVENALRSAASEVIVVLGHEADGVRKQLQGLNVTTVLNPRFAEGQSTSLVVGLRAVHAASDGVIVMMGDQPFVGPEVIDALIQRRRDSGCLIAVPEYGGQRGAPALFASDLFPELMAATGDKGGRDLIQKHADCVQIVPVASPLAGIDVDSWPEYQELLRRAK